MLHVNRLEGKYRWKNNMGRGHGMLVNSHVKYVFKPDYKPSIKNPFVY